jgi:pyruvate dehydrogenase E1 component
MLHPDSEPRQAYVGECLSAGVPAVASTDYIRAFADQVRAWVPGRYTVLGTDGFGRSDYREALRAFFEVDRRYVVLAALRELDPELAAQAIERYEIDPEAPIPTSV